MTAEPASETSELRGRLAALMQTMHVDATAAQIDGLLDHVLLVARWNAVYNLTAVRRTDEMLVQHVADCLAVVQPLRLHLARMDAQRRSAADQDDGGPWSVLDAGSGAGFPGLVIARMCAETRVACVDSVGKKAAFLSQVIAATALTNAQAVHARVESLPHASQDVIVARAYASLRDLVETTAPLLRKGGCWLAMKARHAADEVAGLDPERTDVFHVEQLHVPDLDAPRCIVWMRPR